MSEWQGRSPRQVESNQQVAFWACAALVAVVLGYWILGSLSGSRGHLEKRIIWVQVDSVEYRGVGQDHTLQLEPYWRVWTREPKAVFRLNRGVEAGDSIQIELRHWKK